MTPYRAPLAELQFVMTELAGLDDIAGLPGFEDIAPDTVAAVLDEAAKFASEVLDPLNRVDDREGARAAALDRADAIPMRRCASASSRSPSCVVAKLLKAIAQKERPQLILLGKQAIDDDANETGQMLAALLDWPQATFASKLDIAGGMATVYREIDGGREVVEVERLQSSRRTSVSTSRVARRCRTS